MKKIAVLLCGSGYKDGSEIRESVAALWALSKHQAQVHCFALNENQMHVVKIAINWSKPLASRAEKSLPLNN